MKKILPLFIIMASLMLTGCMNEHEIKETKEKSQEVMLDYLQRHYKVKNVTDITLETDNLFGTTYTGTSGGSFKVNNKDYLIICHTNKECYDSYTYEEKVKPLIIKILKDNINNPNLETNNIELLEFGLDTGPYTWRDFNGLFNADITMNSEKDFIDYCSEKKFEIVLTYTSSEEMIPKNLNNFENLYKILKEKFNMIYSYIDVKLDKGTYLEQLSFIENNTKDNYKITYSYYNNVTIDNYNIYWVSKEITDMNTENQEENIVNYNINIIDNSDNYFENNITEYNNEYYLYNSKILQITKETEKTSDIYIKLDEHICGEQNNEIFYKNNDSYYSTTSLIHNVFEYNINYDYDDINDGKLAIYCKK